MTSTSSAISTDSTRPAGQSLAAALAALTKPRVAIASVLTAWAGYAATPGPGGWAESLALLAGAGMSAGGALTFNQWWERETDPLMARTRLRPLATGAVSPKLALAWSILLSCGGLALLAVIFNMAAMGLSAAIIFVYCFIYTPMKRLTHWATEVGSVSGAIPPLLGAAAAGNVWSVPAWVLAVALLFWQMPHFFSIGWIYREDYRAAGLPLLPTLDQSGRRAALWSFGYSLCLAPALILPWALGKMGIFYAAAAIASSAAILAASWRFLRTANGDRRREARLLFRITLITLPVLMLAVVCDGR